MSKINRDFIIAIFISTICLAQSNHSLSFDGDDDHVDLGSPQQLEFGSGNFTFIARFKANSVNRQWVISNYFGNGTYPLWMVGTTPIDNKGVLHYDIRSNGSSGGGYGTTDVADGNWHSVAFIREENNFKLYLDGELESEQIHDVGPLTTGNYYKIGMDHTSHWQVWDGFIDDVSMFNVALSAEQIDYILDLGISGSEDNL